MLTTRTTTPAGVCRAKASAVQRRPVFGQAPMIPSRHTSRTVVCQGLFGLGLPELAVIAGVAALIFGPSKLPELGRGLGKTVKSFQSAASEFNTELKAGMEGDKAEAGKADAAAPTSTPAAPTEVAKKD